MVFIPNHQKPNKIAIANVPDAIPNVPLWVANSYTR